MVETACTKHKVPPHEVAVLTLETLDEGSPWRLTQIGNQPTADHPQVKCITVSTVRRFKGLEATLVLVVDVDLRHAIDNAWRRRLYVACSRARHALHIVTTTKERELEAPIRAFAETEKNTG